MKVLILAGGYGTRISDVNSQIPKPMIKIDDKPIIEHIINIYKSYNLKKFIVLSGYKYREIKIFFDKNYKKFSSCEIKILNTGLNTLTGNRVMKAKKFITESDFMVTYGDGLSDINLNSLYKFHKKSHAIGTVTAVRPPARFGELLIEKKFVKKFDEKVQLNKSWINGGFFVFKKSFFKFIPNKKTMLETLPMQNLIKINKLASFQHKGFWHCIDNRRDLETIKKLIKKRNTPWIIKT